MLNFRDYCGLYTFFAYGGVRGAKLLTYDNRTLNPEVVTKCVNVNGYVHCDTNCSSILGERKHTLILYNTASHIGTVIGYRHTIFDIFVRAIRSIT
jgi:hypothetical protein